MEKIVTPYNTYRISRSASLFLPLCLKMFFIWSVIKNGGQLRWIHNWFSIGTFFASFYAVFLFVVDYLVRWLHSYTAIEQSIATVYTPSINILETIDWIPVVSINYIQSIGQPIEVCDLGITVQVFHLFPFLFLSITYIFCPSSCSRWSFDLSS